MTRLGREAEILRGVLQWRSDLVVMSWGKERVAAYLEVAENASERLKCVFLNCK